MTYHYSLDELVHQLAAAIGDQRLPAHLIDDICADIERLYGAEAVTPASDAAIAILERGDRARENLR